MQINSVVSFYTHVNPYDKYRALCMLIMLITTPQWFLAVELHATSKEQNQIIAFIFITQNFSIKSDEKSKWMEQRCKDRDKDTKTSSIFFSFLSFLFLFPFFYFFRSVINKPTKQHVAYQ